MQPLSLPRATCGIITSLGGHISIYTLLQLIRLVAKCGQSRLAPLSRMKLPAQMINLHEHPARKPGGATSLHLHEHCNHASKWKEKEDVAEKAKCQQMQVR